MDANVGLGFGIRESHLCLFMNPLVTFAALFPSCSLEDFFFDLAHQSFPLYVFTVSLSIEQQK